MPNSREKDSSVVQSARERILTTAHDLFYRDGVRATGVDRLIAESRVTKVTFYRHFPSKDAVVLAFLDHRHTRWMGWFSDSLARHRAAQTPAARKRAPLAPVVEAMREWFGSPAFRGCAFINTVAELGDALPAVVERASAHKKDMTGVIATLLPSSRAAVALARAAAVAVDGAIVRAQAGENGRQEAIAGLTDLLTGLTGGSSRR